MFLIFIIVTRNKFLARNVVIAMHYNLRPPDIAPVVLFTNVSAYTINNSATVADHSAPKYQILAKADNPRRSNWWFNQFSYPFSGVILYRSELGERCVWNLGRRQDNHRWPHHFFTFWILLLKNVYSAQIQASSRQRRWPIYVASLRNQCRPESKMEAKFRSFTPSPSVKIRGWVAKCLSQWFKISLSPKSQIYRYTWRGDAVRTGRFNTIIPSPFSVANSVPPILKVRGETYFKFMEKIGGTPTFRFHICCSVSEIWRLRLKIEAKFHTFWPYEI